MNNYLVVMLHPKDRTSPGMIVNENLDRSRALRIARALNEDRWNNWNYWAVSEENFKQSFSDEENQK